MTRAALGAILSDIKIAHSVFALPFALLSLFVASGGWPAVRVLLLVLLALVAARSAAMALNRLADARIDAANPRTRGRALPQGRVAPGAVAGFVAVSAGLFVLAAVLLNPLAGALAPVVLLVLLGYSFTKRFTPHSHFVLGLALALAPLGAWVAARGTLAGGLAAPLLLGGGVLLWTAGFDLIYACQDRDFDRGAGLHSIPARFGVAAALRLSTLLHVGAAALFGAFLAVTGSGALGWLGLALAGALLVHEHRIVRPDDLSRVNVAFFTLNGAVSLVFSALAITDLVLRG
jgi:4-hydroxybenzoate polyprenyltransferase